jgi:hypothetical protein
VPTDENLMIARHTWELLDRRPQAAERCEICGGGALWKVSVGFTMRSTTAELSGTVRPQANIRSAAKGFDSGQCHGLAGMSIQYGTAWRQRQ